MSHILNIGLPAGQVAAEVDRILTAMTKVCISVQSFEVVESCLVAEVTSWGPYQNRDDAYFVLARALDRDCIAVYDKSTDTGKLLGPRAEAWPAFSAQSFVFPSEVVA